MTRRTDQRYIIDISHDVYEDRQFRVTANGMREAARLVLQRNPEERGFFVHVRHANSDAPYDRSRCSSSSTCPHAWLA